MCLRGSLDEELSGTWLRVRRWEAEGEVANEFGCVGARDGNAEAGLVFSPGGSWGEKTLGGRLASGESFTVLTQIRVEYSYPAKTQVSKLYILDMLDSSGIDAG